MSDAPITSFVLKGNLKNNESLQYDFVNNECRLGLWKLCILNVGYECLFEKRVLASVNEFVQINTNLVRGHQSKDGVLENYNVPMAHFLLKGSKGEKKMINFDKTWFYINSPGDQLNLYFLNPLTNEKTININIDIFVTVLIQQIK
jgi:hypothetical protein